MFVTSSSVCVFLFPSVRYHGEVWDVNICTNNQSSGDGCRVAAGQLSCQEQPPPMGLNRGSSGESFGAQAMNSGEHQEWWHASINIYHLNVIINLLNDSFNDNKILTCHWSKELTDYIKKKRRFVLVAVTSIFVVTTIIMVMSVIHVEMNQTIVGYEVSSFCFMFCL